MRFLHTSEVSLEGCGLPFERGPEGQAGETSSVVNLPVPQQDLLPRICKAKRTRGTGPPSWNEEQIRAIGLESSCNSLRIATSANRNQRPKAGGFAETENCASRLDFGALGAYYGAQVERLADENGCIWFTIDNNPPIVNLGTWWAPEWYMDVRYIELGPWSTTNFYYYLGGVY